MSRITSHPAPLPPAPAPRFTFAEMQARSLSLWQVSALDELREGPLHYVRTLRGYGIGWGRPGGINLHNDGTIGSLLLRGLAVLGEDAEGRPIIRITPRGRAVLLRGDVLTGAPAPQGRMAAAPYGASPRSEMNQ